MVGLLSLIQNESGGNYQAQNNAMGAGGMAGHFGRLQFGQARLQDAMNAGIIPQGFTPQQFMADPAAQQRVEQWHFSDIDSQAESMGLNRFIGQNVGGAQIDQEAIRAMAHLGGIGGARQFLESGGQYNPSDVNGTSLSDYASRHGGGAAQIGADTMAALGRPQGGLLSTSVSAMNAPPQEPARRSFWDNIPGLSDPDRRARLAIGLEGLTLNPNEGWMQSMQGGIDTRREDARMNETAQWLRSQPGGEQFAAYYEATGDTQGAFNAYLQSQQPVAGPEPTSAMQNYEYLLAQGVDPETASTQAFGGGGTTVNVGGDSAGPSIGPTPQGYAVVATPVTPENPSGFRMEAIPGGPEDVSAAAAAAAGNDLNASDTIVASAGYARAAAGNRQVDGVLGSIAAYNPMSTNAEVYRQVDTLKSMAISNNLQAMRDASPTGGALGSVTPPELTLLANMSGTLDPKSPNFQRDLDAYERTLLRTVHGRDQGDIIFAQTRSPAKPEITTTTLAPATPFALSPEAQAILDRNP